MLTLSARNQIPGTRKGAAMTHLRTEIAPGVVFTAAVADESAGELGFAAGRRAVAVVKASDVMVGTEG